MDALRSTRARDVKGVYQALRRPTDERGAALGATLLGCNDFPDEDETYAELERCVYEELPVTMRVLALIAEDEMARAAKSSSRASTLADAGVPYQHWKSLDNIEKAIEEVIAMYDMPPRTMPPMDFLATVGYTGLREGIRRWGGAQQVAYALNYRVRGPGGKLLEPDAVPSTVVDLSSALDDEDDDDDDEVDTAVGAWLGSLK